MPLLREPNSVAANLRKWDREHRWTRDGDEWAGQARACGQPYDRWKQSVVDAFIRPHLAPGGTAVEIAPGHGRWTDAIVAVAGRTVLADLSPTCIEFCRRRFEHLPSVEYHVNDGRSLPFVATRSVDFIWSYDSFVHMSPGVIGSYFDEFRRILKPERVAVIHHAGRRDGALWLGSLLRFGTPGRAVFKRISMPGSNGGDGWRSNVSRERIRRLAGRHGLVVRAQVNTWGQNGEFGIPRFGDCISILSQPGGPRQEHRP